MVALSDMVITYTALVDAHTPRLAACIRDRHELVRRQVRAGLGVAWGWWGGLRLHALGFGTRVD
jgi:hypothetical protein